MQWHSNGFPVQITSRFKQKVLGKAAQGFNVHSSKSTQSKPRLGPNFGSHLVPFGHGFERQGSRGTTVVSEVVDSENTSCVVDVVGVLVADAEVVCDVVDSSVEVGEG